MEHPHILDRVAEDDDQDDDQADGVNQSASAGLDSPIETEDGSRPSSSMSSVSRGKKRRRHNLQMVGAQLKGNDFWSMVEKWFAARMQTDQLGTSWTTSGWTKYVLHSYIYWFSITEIKGYEHRYIEETLTQDRAKFKPVPSVNPFLTDFMTEVTEGDGNDGDTRAAGAIGSMQGILGAL